MPFASTKVTLGAPSDGGPGFGGERHGPGPGQDRRGTPLTPAAAIPLAGDRYRLAVCSAAAVASRDDSLWPACGGKAQSC
jgi:hypothetical protein